MKISKGWKWFLGVFGVLVIGLWVEKIILIDLYPTLDEDGFSVDLEKVRAMAKADSSEMPIRLNSLLIAIENVPEFATYAGGGLTEVSMSMRVHQVVYANQTVMIDPVHDELLHRQNNYGGPYFPEAFTQMQEAMKKASLILSTHEHFDHIGGVSRSPFFESIRSKVLLTEEQLSSPEILKAGFVSEMLAQFDGIHYEDYHSPAPGIVLIKSPGHTPGHQMIYLQLLDGTEYLFVGDIAWSKRNIYEIKGRPKLVSMLLNEDVMAVAYQLRWLNHLSTSESIHILVSHDHPDQMKQMEENLYTDKLEF
ncbi:MAG: hypothetical protein R3B93_09125 [Bacteroidia bacterium]